MKVCAVIPAAGIGSRLGLKVPKILLPLTKNTSVWTILREKLLPLVDHIHIIASPIGEAAIQEAAKTDIERGLVSISIQTKPLGMGDAIFLSHAVWSQAQSILIVWGDQVFVSEQTLKRTIAAHAGVERTIGLPLTKIFAPYVEYIFDNNSKLINVKQTREGDICATDGLSDVGTFILSVQDLLPAWNTFLKSPDHGQQTGEINFLPFLPFLSAKGWRIKTIKISDTTEARGINTAADLSFFQNLFNTAGST